MYLSESLPYIQEYWRFFLVKSGVTAAPPAVAFDPSGFDAAMVPEGSLVLAHVEDRAVQSAAEQGLLRLLVLVPELGREPMFALHKR